MIPALQPIVSQRLLYSSQKTRLNSEIFSNFVIEHFDDTSCADIYEVHGSNKLGKGSYGSVYLASHRITGKLILYILQSVYIVTVSTVIALFCVELSFKNIRIGCRNFTFIYLYLNSHFIDSLSSL